MRSRSSLLTLDSIVRLRSMKKYAVICMPLSSNSETTVRKGGVLSMLLFSLRIVRTSAIAFSTSDS